MALVETKNNIVYWSDIEDLVAGGGTNEQIAAALNDDYRHVNDGLVGAVFDMLFTELEQIAKDLGNNADPDADSANWRGIFDQAIRDLPETGQVNPLVRKGWNRMLTHMAVDAPRPIPLVPTYAPQSTQQMDKVQKAGLVMEQFDKIAQTEASNPLYSDGPYFENEQGVHDQWVLLTGGRRFGIVTAADVQAVKDQRDADEARQSSQQTTREATARAQVAVDAANASYANGDSDSVVRATYKAAWDGWTEPTLPYPPLS